MNNYNNIRKEQFQIRSYEIDPSGKVTIQSICNYLQEIASNHAYELGVSVHTLFKQKLTWVLSRLHLQMKAYLKWSEKITIETWPSGVNGLFAIRDFHIFSEQNELIGKATTSWMMLDLKKNRPITMPDFIQDIKLPDRPRAIDDKFKKLEIPHNYDFNKTFNVRLSDLDVNQHVNYVNYIEWAVETIPIDIWQNFRLDQLEVSFRAESKLGNQILSRAHQTKKSNQYIFLHKLSLESDNTELAILKTKWIVKQKIKN